MVAPKMTLPTLMVEFDTDAECRTALEGLRWPNGIECPHCGSKKISRIHTRKQLDCNGCRYRFSVTTGTIFHDSHLPLSKWFLATYLMCESKKGISANQLKRVLGISYKTAWYLCHRIRAAVKEAHPQPLTGTIEVDETWVGGKRRHVGKGYVGNKTMVLGAIERGGNVRMRTDKTPSHKVLRAFISEYTASNAKRLITDDHPGYRGIEDVDTKHEYVNHRAEEWVRGDVHTNNIESAWSLFKRSIVGAYHQVSKKHLDAYLDEFEFRFNNRKNLYLFRDTITRLIQAQAMPYETLIA